MEGSRSLYGSFRKLGVPYSGVLKIRILLFRVLYYVPLFSETPKKGLNDYQYYFGGSLLQLEV